MHLYKLAIGMTVGVLLSVAAGWAEARQIHIEGTFSAVFSPLDSDANNDGIKAGLVVVTGRSIGGRRFTGQTRSEFLSALPAPVTCPSGTVEFPLLVANSVSTDVLTGDQLFSYSTVGTSCVNPVTGAYTYQGTFIYFGGTGRMAGATGSSQANTSGFFHICDPTDGCFGSETGTYTGTLTLP